MPEPTAAAMEAARDFSWNKHGLPHDAIEALAAALDAFAAELRDQVREAHKLVKDRNNAFHAACDERDAALARAEAAEAQAARLETWRAKAINLYPGLDDRASLLAGEVW